MKTGKNVNGTIEIKGRRRIRITRIWVTIGTVDNSAAVNDAADAIGGTAEEVLEAFEQSDWFLPIYKRNTGGRLVQAVVIVDAATTPQDLDDIIGMVLEEIILDVLFDGHREIYGRLPESDCLDLCKPYAADVEAVKSELIAAWTDQELEETEIYERR